MPAQAGSEHSLELPMHCNTPEMGTPTLCSPCSTLCRCPPPPDPIPAGATTCLLKGGLWYRQPEVRSGTTGSCASALVVFAPQGWWECRGWHWGAMSPSGRLFPFSWASPSPACLCTRLCSHPLPGFGVRGDGGKQWG